MAGRRRVTPDASRLRPTSFDFPRGPSPPSPDAGPVLRLTGGGATGVAGVDGNRTPRVLRPPICLCARAALAPADHLRATAQQRHPYRVSPWAPRTWTLPGRQRERCQRKFQRSIRREMDWLPDSCRSPRAPSPLWVCMLPGSAGPLHPNRPDYGPPSGQMSPNRRRMTGRSIR